MKNLQVIDMTASPCKTESITRLMAETLPLYGYESIKAACTGFKAPDMVNGALKDAAPALYAHKPRPLYMDVSFFDDLSLDDIRLRWQLFDSASDQVNGSFHVAVPAFVSGKFTNGKTVTGREFCKKLADSCGVEIDRIWEL